VPQRLLKPLRVGVALVFLAATTAVFLDLKGQVPALAFEAVLWPQLAPSLVRFAHGAAWGAAGLLFVLLLTLLFGRVFCSAICPLGVLQDVIIRLGAWRARGSKRARFRFRRPWSWTRYGLLAATVLTALSGSLLLVAQLDPFSHFGRLLGLLARPLLVWTNNLAARGLEGLGSYALAPADFALAHWQALIVPLAVLGLLVWMAGRHGRLFCNSLCPVGTLLGLLSRYALFRVAIDTDRCNLCAKCSVQCKAECIHLKDRRVDFDRCVACFNCIPACPEGGIGYRLARKTPAASGEAPGQGAPLAQGAAGGEVRGRRAFLGASAASALGLIGFAAMSRAREWPVNKKPTLVPVVKGHPVAPPGAGSTDRFNLACTACQLCVSACPTQVLQPSLLAYGAKGFLQPRMAYEVAYCTYECTRCTEICPTDAIRPLTTEAKKVAKIGEVRFIEENCIVVTEETACGACAEHCPTQAVHMVPHRGVLTIPALEEDVCIGCGACEHACPVRPHRAIYVEGEPVHRVAEVPEGEALEVVVPEEFPF
jgi:polyferredoxin